MIVSGKFFSFPTCILFRLSNVKLQLVIVGCILTLLPVKSYAQFFVPPDDSKLHIGFNAGFVQSEIEGSFVDYELSRNLAGKRPEVHGKDGIEVEAVVTMKIFKFLYCKTGIGYNEQGGEIRHNDLVYPMDIKLSYLDIPATVGVHMVRLKKLSVAAEGGIQLNQEISPEQNFKKGVISKNWSNTFIPAATYGLSAAYKVNDRISIRGSYKFMKAIRPFYEHEYFDSRISMNTVAESFSGGVLISLR